MNKERQIANAGVKVKGNILFFYTFDVGEEIDLEKIKRKGLVPVRSVPLSPYFKNYHIPLFFELPEEPKKVEDTFQPLTVDGASCISSKIHNFGVISFCYKIPFENSLDELKLKVLDVKKIFDHTVKNGIDTESGGVYVEGPHSGGVYDREKEFWQQAEVLTAMLDAYLLFGDEKFIKAYNNVHRFVIDKVVNKGVGEWYPLLTRSGEPIWTHMGHSWKINYHTVRSMIQSIKRLDKILLA